MAPIIDALDPSKNRRGTDGTPSSGNIARDVKGKRICCNMANITCQERKSMDDGVFEVFYTSRSGLARL